MVLSAPLPGCEAHVVDARGERAAPCGSPVDTWGTAAGWIEGATFITPFLTDLSRGGDYALRGEVAAGMVAFPSDRKLNDGERIRLVSLAAPRDEAMLRRQFTRDITSTNARPRMPAGRAIALLLDPAGRTIGVSPIIVIRPGTETVVWPQTGATSVLAARLQRPRPITRDGEDEVAVAVSDTIGVHKPAAVVDAADAVFAIWYDLPAETIQLTAESPILRLDRTTAQLARGSVTMIDAALKLRPSLTVTIAPLPDEVRGAASPMTLTVRETVASHSLLSRLVEPGKSYAFELLPASLLQVELKIGDAVLPKRVDLLSGADAHLDIPLDPFFVTGTVFLGDRPVRAIVQVQQRDAPLSVETDDRGTYTLLLWEPQKYVIDTVLADAPATPSFTQLVTITSSTTLDIRIPANALRARVYDAGTGRPIVPAEVVVHNRWKDELGEHSAVKSVTATGALTALPPQQSGTVEIHARAAGYRDADPVVVTADAHLRERVIDIPMTADGNSSGVTIRIDATQPADGAEVALWKGDQMMWHGVADDAGRVSIPDDVARSPLIIRHPSAASDLVLFGALSQSEVLSLSPAAPPLVVRVVHKDGRPIGPRAATISFWLLGGVRLSEAAAGFATWSFGATSPDGTVLLRGLWPRPLRLFATRTASIEQIRSGTFDNLAITIPYPWPAVADVPLVDE